jgi:flagellar assembly factor FliW
MTQSPPFSPTAAGTTRDDAMVTFPHGLPGFETSTRFRLREQSSFAPVAFLESVDSKDLCFLVVPVLALVEQYAMGIAPEDLRTLGLDDSRQPEPGKEVLCLAILTAPEDGALTANLLAPVVINPVTGSAVQAVRADAIYSHRHPVVALRPEAACS